VQHRTGAALLHNAYVEQTLVGWLTKILVHDASILIDREHLIRRKLTFIATTRTHREPERLTLDHRTQIPTRPKQPPAPMKALRSRREVRRKFREVLCHERKMLPNTPFAQARVYAEGVR
jgi:hypothetical protein